MTRPTHQAAAAEFDRWADAGRAESMGRGHRPTAELGVAEWILGAADVVLDVGCGNGWAARMLIERGAGRALGVDVAPKMIARAQAATAGDARFDFRVGTGAALPWVDGTATHVVSVESLYYYPDPAAALVEWARVARTGARLALMVDLYRENRGSHSWIEALPVGVWLHSADEYAEMARAAGFRDVSWRQLRTSAPPKPREDFEPSRYWPSYEMYLAHHQAGSLLVSGQR